MEVEMLVIGSPEGNASFVAAKRCDHNRTAVDAVILPSHLKLQPAEEGLPQHPMVLLRTYENVQMVMDPDYLRMIGDWMAEAAEWLQDHIERGD